MLLNVKRASWIAASSIFFIAVTLNSVIFLKNINGADTPEIHRDTGNNPALQERQKIINKGVLSSEDLVEIDRLWLIAIEVIEKENEKFHAEALEHKAKRVMEPRTNSLAMASLIWLLFLLWVKPTPKEIIFPQILIFLILSSNPITIIESLLLTALNVAFIVHRLKIKKST